MACTGCYNTVSDAYCFCFVKKLCTILCLAWQCRFIQRFPNNGTVTFNYAVGANVDAYVYAMAYVTVNDESGKETTYYSDVLAITYNTIS